MDSSLSPTTSEMMSDRTVAGYNFSARRPPLKSERCFLTALVSSIFAPDFRRRLVVFCLSERVNPMEGSGMRAEPPPEIRQITKSSSEGCPTSRSMFLTPRTPPSLGIGWDAGLNLICLVLGHGLV